MRNGMYGNVNNIVSDEQDECNCRKSSSNNNNNNNHVGYVLDTIHVYTTLNQGVFFLH